MARNARLTTFARANRSAMTEPETRIWLALRAERFEGVKFRRQKVIGPYIADFAANDPRIVVEIDGDTHGLGQDHDAQRTRFLEGKGYRVVRFANSEVMTNLEGVLMRLSEVLAEARKSPLPTLSPEGERAKLAGFLSPSGERVEERGNS